MFPGCKEGGTLATEVSYQKMYKMKSVEARKRLVTIYREIRKWHSYINWSLKMAHHWSGTQNGRCSDSFRKCQWEDRHSNLWYFGLTHMSTAQPKSQYLSIWQESRDGQRLFRALRWRVLLIHGQSTVDLVAVGTQSKTIMLARSTFQTLVRLAELELSSV